MKWREQPGGGAGDVEKRTQDFVGKESELYLMLCDVMGGF